MKKLLCGLGIFFLTILILLPPALRIFVPEKTETEKPKEKLVIKALSCDGDKYIARTSYENDNVKMILIKKNIALTEKDEENKEEVPSEDQGENQTETRDNEETTPDETPTEDTNQTNPETSTDLEEFEAVFTRLSEDSRVARSDMDDGISLTIDFSVPANSDLNIGNITKPIDEQKVYYENLGLTCSIIE